MATQKKQLTKRIRRTPEEARALALESARRLLIAEGPDAITLQAVAADLGMSHTNLIHHFGSAGGLQSALMGEMVRELTSVLEKAVERFRAGEGSEQDFVDIVFEVFDKGGAGRLAAWIVLSGESDKLEPVGEVVRTYIRNVERGADDAHGDVHERITSASLLVTLAAFGDAVIGDSIGSMMGRERKAMRRIIAELLPMVLMPPKRGK
ncbi:AcrR family transcriptional regulator [Povalibacter uvarum]|uniref:AcrR family transcriptional regulator n=1 Tax=Povalibacter uvarum TaxID=732238 RepID=A0A841HJZ9_9GAMM|nr:TetR/AcrR family transcriptional regulator [Povalibacter uvarum]MBB6093531.1 AcrR family transcriptional regulator [Povalibacter uvarum]